MSLIGKTAIVTGGGRGIGRAIAIDLAREGCNVVAASRNASELEEVTVKIKEAGATGLGLQLDLGVESNIYGLVDETMKHFGKIDILINNAAVHFIDSFLNTKLEEWDMTMNLNLRTPFILSQKVLNIMKERQNGYIINVSSSVAYNVAGRVTAYSVSKVALKAMSDALYEEAIKFGVKVSTIYPGIVDTRMVAGTDLLGGPDKWMKPEDISYCVLFLLKQSQGMLVRDIFPTNMPL